MLQHPRSVPIDSYCFELLSMILALTGSDVGRHYVAQQSTLIEDFVVLLHTGSPRMQRQVNQTCVFTSYLVQLSLTLLFASDCSKLTLKLFLLILQRCKVATWCKWALHLSACVQNDITQQSSNVPSYKRSSGYAAAATNIEGSDAGTTGVSDERPSPDAVQVGGLRYRGAVESMLCLISCFWLTLKHAWLQWNSLIPKMEFLTLKKNKSSNVYVCLRCLREGPILIIERRSYYSHCVLIG